MEIGAIKCDERSTRGLLLLKSFTKKGWVTHLASLRARAESGDVSAVTDLGLTLLEGIQGRDGRSIIRRQSRAAIALLLKAADGGNVRAASTLGYAYDVGLGAKHDVKEAVRWYRRAIRRGDSVSATNLATLYRDAGNSRMAFRWWKRSEEMHDGDAAVDVGYCYQYGIGTRKNGANARRMFSRAIESKNITSYAREEAMYHLALHFIDEEKPSQAKVLLDRATKDQDFSEAASVLSQLATNLSRHPCRCRRFRRQKLLGHARCQLHPQA